MVGSHGAAAHLTELQESCPVALCLTEPHEYCRPANRWLTEWVEGSPGVAPRLTEWVVTELANRWLTEWVEGSPGVAPRLTEWVEGNQGVALRLVK